MNEASKKQRDLRSLSGWVQTVPRCHAVGASLSIAVIFATAWVWSLGHTPAATLVSGVETIDQGEAITLIKNADQWRELDAISCKKRRSLRARGDSVNQWLPSIAELNEVEQILMSLGEDCKLHVFSVREGERTCGSRVCTLSVSCEIRGSFPCLCRFLHELSHLEHPIACSELHLHRSIIGQETHAEMNATRSEQPCRATLTLRVPYAISERESVEDQHAA